MAGLEVDRVEPACPDLSGVVVAGIVAVDSQPPDLKRCEVEFGAEHTVTVACGAANVHAGMITVLARPGALLAGGARVGDAEPGLLCSERDLGLTEDTHGIIELDPSFTVGRPLAEYLAPTDSIIEIGVTPNRGDCLSIKGVAREVAILSGCALNDRDIEVAEPGGAWSRKVNLNAPGACPKYLGRVITGLDCGRPSPFWMRERLRRSGVRPISAVVDISNYVMLELGQPLHVFDQDKLTGEISVRYPQARERLTLLGGAECELRPDTLIIADEAGPLALAGIMGGLDSAVTADSRNLFLECAYFSPEAMMGQARLYGLHTDSSHRFERGVDPQLQADAIEAATCLMVSICGGRAGPVIEVKDEDNLPQSVEIHLRLAQVSRVIGVDMSERQIQVILERLGMRHTRVADGWKVKSASHRFDLAMEADLIEELVRIWGYENIPPATPEARLAIRPDNVMRSRLITSRSVLVQRGYQEAITFSFVDPGIQDLLELGMDSIPLANPIAPEISDMRLSLWPGLLAAARYNLKRQQRRVRLFEIGRVFKNGRDLAQDRHIGGVSIGDYYDNQWNKPYNSCDFYDIKADMQSWFSTLGMDRDVHYSLISHGALHPGQAAGVYYGTTRIGLFGRLHPRIGAALGLPEDCYLFEFNAEKMNVKAPPAIRSLSRFPAVKRDLAIEIDEDIPVSEVMDCIRDRGGEEFYELELFDVYRGEGVGPGKKSLALGLTFQKISSTLEDKEVESIMGDMLNSLAGRFGATLRGE